MCVSAWRDGIFHQAETGRWREAPDEVYGQSQKFSQCNMLLLKVDSTKNEDRRSYRSLQKKRWMV